MSDFLRPYGLQGARLPCPSAPEVAKSQTGAFLVAQSVKNSPVIQETWVRPLGLGRSPGGGQWLPTPVSWPAESHEQRSLAGYGPWGHKELDKTQRLNTHKTIDNRPIF